MLQKIHGPNLFTYAGSKFFERASYYGLRSIMLLYVIEGSMGMSRMDALVMYGYFTSLVFLSHLPGALLGDLLLGNKKTLIIGGIIQALGAFCMAIPMSNSFYMGLGFIILGGGLYTPNLMAHFGKFYLEKKRLLYAGFTGLHTASNLGAFLGIFFIGLVGEKVSWSAGFVLAGILMVISVILIFVSSKTEDREENTKESEVLLSKEHGLLKILVVFLLFGLFWFFYEFTGARIAEIKQILSSNSELSVGQAFWSIFDSGTQVLIGVLAVIFASMYYNDQLTKIAFGFLLGAASLGIILLFPSSPTEGYFLPYMLFLILMAMAEILISPSIYTTITRYANPKYLAIIFSFVFIPIQFANTYVGFLTADDTAEPFQTVSIAAGCMLLLALVLFLWVISDKKIVYDLQKIEEEN